MSSKYYKLQEVEEVAVVPKLVETYAADPEAQKWQQSKKLLRKWYINKAATVRKLTEQEVHA